MSKTTEQIPKKSLSESATVNACKLCSPLGASLVFKGLKGCVPLIHGSQGCATYIRRYLISHYREPIDIASTNFVEETTIFGGAENFYLGLDNIISQYSPEVIGICTTCLSETIGDDINMFLNEYKKSREGVKLPEFVSASTPSYQGTHMEGFHVAVKAVVTNLVEDSTPNEYINIFPGFVSPADLRYIKDIMDDFGLPYIMVPDYSLSLDNPTWGEYKRIPEGGTSIELIRKAGGARASLEFGSVLGESSNNTAAAYLEAEFGVKRYALSTPTGVNATDAFFKVLEELSGEGTPEKHLLDRGRLIDSYVDGHKYLFGKKAVVYGEEDFVAGLMALLEEIGIETILCASGGESEGFFKVIDGIAKGSSNPENSELIIRNGMDFDEIDQLSETLDPDIFIGHSKGYYIARKLNKPIVRCGFPIHDRIGAQRVLHLGYQGSQQLFDNICNALMQAKQDNSPIGYKYI